MHDTRPFKAPIRIDASRSLFPVFTCISHHARTHDHGHDHMARVPR
jgi:hypothetical protein